MTDRIHRGPAAAPPAHETHAARSREAPPPCRAFSLAPETATAATPAAARPAGPLSPALAAPIGPTAESAKQLITRILADEAAVDRGLRAAMSGKPMSVQELLVLQAQVIQYSQELEVASRVVDKATGAVRQVLQTQV